MSNLPPYQLPPDYLASYLAFNPFVCLLKSTAIIGDKIIPNLSVKLRKIVYLYHLRENKIVVQY